MRTFEGVASIQRHFFALPLVFFIAEQPLDELAQKVRSHVETDRLENVKDRLHKNHLPYCYQYRSGNVDILQHCGKFINKKTLMKKIIVGAFFILEKKFYKKICKKILSVIKSDCD